jgi:O-antigen/teichoic acid export membrane protein
VYKKLASATAIYALAPQIPKLVSLFMLPVLTPHLSSYDYGINGVLFAYLGMADAFKDLGLSLIFTNAFFKYPRRYKFLWRRLFGFIQVWSLLFGLLLIPALWLVLPVSERHHFFLIIMLVLLPIMFFDPVTQVGMRYFQLNQQPVSFVTVAIICSFTAILVNYITIVPMQMGYLGLLAGQFGAKAMAFVIYAGLVFFKLKLFPSLQFSIGWIKKKVLLCAPMIPHFYAGYLLNTSDRVMLDLFKIDLNKIGVYAFAYSIGTYFSIIGKGMADAATPLMMAEYKKGTMESELKVRNMVWLMQGTLLVGGVFACLWVRELFILVARNESLRESYLYAIPVIMAYTFYPMYYGSNAKLRFHERTNIIWKVSFIAGMVSIGLNLLLIPLIGIAGAAITTFLAYMFMGYRGYWLRDFRTNNLVDYKPILWLGATLLSIVVVYLLADMQWGVKAMLSMGIAASLFFYRTKLIAILK